MVFGRAQVCRCAFALCQMAAAQVDPVLEEVFKKLGLNSVKHEQQLAIAGVLKGDVFVVLPTGFGKSACYQCLPLLYDKLYPRNEPSIVIVVTPLKAIMKDQVS